MRRARILLLLLLIAGASLAYYGYRNGWELPEVPSTSRYRAVFAANGLRVLHDVDYSASFLIMPPEKLDSLEARYRNIYSMVPLAGPRFIASAFLGGLALERLYHKGLVQYRLIVAQGT